VGIRETLNENPRAATGVAIGLIGLTLIWVVWSLWPARPMAPGDFKQFYTDDDGTSYFKDTAGQVAPFKHDGRDAVVAFVFRGARGKPFVGYMEKYTDLGKQKKEEIKADKQHPQRLRMELYPLEQTEKLVKKPGAGNPWVNPAKDPALAAQIRQVSSPDGSPVKPVSVDE
jgi:hypothetical protein